MATVPIVDLLQKAGILDDRQHDTVISRAGSSAGGKLIQEIAELGYSTESNTARALSLELGLPRVDFTMTPPEEEALRLLDLRLCLDRYVLPLALRERGELLWLAMADPTEAETMTAVRRRSGKRVKPVVCPATELVREAKRLYGLIAQGGLHMGGDPNAIELKESELGDEEVFEVVPFGESLGNSIPPGELRGPPPTEAPPRRAATIPPGNQRVPTAPPGNQRVPTAPPGNQRVPTIPPGNQRVPTAPPGNQRVPTEPPANRRAATDPPANQRPGAQAQAAPRPAVAPPVVARQGTNPPGGRPPSGLPPIVRPAGRADSSQPPVLRPSLGQPVPLQTLLARQPGPLDELLPARASRAPQTDDLSDSDLTTLHALQQSLERGAMVLQAIAELCVERKIFRPEELDARTKR